MYFQNNFEELRAYDLALSRLIKYIVIWWYFTIKQSKYISMGCETENLKPRPKSH